MPSRTTAALLLIGIASACYDDEPKRAPRRDVPPAEEDFCERPRDAPDFCPFCPADPGCERPPVCAEPGRDSCFTAGECPGPVESACRDECCIELCASDDDCAARPECVSLPDGCTCDDRLCVPWTCSNDEACDPAERCVGGACAAPAATELVDACVVEPRRWVARAGESQQFSARAFAGATPLVVALDAAAWSVEGAGSIDASGRFVAGTEDGLVTIEARIGAARCIAEVQNFAASTDDLRVVVMDEASGGLVEGATVLVDGLEATTDARGLAHFAGPSASPRTVTVLHPAFAWTTVVGVRGGDLLLPLRRSRAGPLAGGIQGDVLVEDGFNGFELPIALSGTAFRGDLASFSPAILLGPRVETRFTVVFPTVAAWPAGLEVGAVREAVYKERFHAVVGPGRCDDEPGSAAGRCGTTTAWTFAERDVRGELPESIVEGRDLTLGFEHLLGWYLPSLASGQTAVDRDLAYELVPLRLDAADVPSVDLAHFPRADLSALRSRPLRTRVLVPPLPTIAAAWLEGAVVLGAAHTPGGELVPLGITAGLDVPLDSDELPDGRLSSPRDDGTSTLSMRLAPLHAGLEGSGYVVLATATNPGGAEVEPLTPCTLQDRAGCPAVSGVLARRDALPFDTLVELDPFLGFAEGLTWSEPTRQAGLSPLVEGASLYTLVLTSPSGDDWHVWFDGYEPVTLPLPPPRFADRAWGASARVNALRLRTGGLDELVGFGPARLANVADETTAFSSFELPTR